MKVAIFFVIYIAAALFVIRFMAACDVGGDDDESY